MAHGPGFTRLAARHGGIADPGDVAAAGPGLAWLGEVLRGLSVLTNSYVGDRNRRGQVYAVESGLFDSMEFNGAAHRDDTRYVFGMTLGAVLRIVYGAQLLAQPELDADQCRALAWVMGAGPEDPPPESFATAMARAADPAASAMARSMTFFALGFVWMHEAFHTLIGHVDFVRETLGLPLDELSLGAADPFHRDVLQALELDADGAAMTNLCLTVARNPRFGICADGDLDPAHRVAQAAEGGFLALLALEWRRRVRGDTAETSHPAPARRFASARGLLATSERRGGLPRGSLYGLARRADRLVPHLEGSPAAPLLGMLGNGGAVPPGDSARLSELIALGRAELAVFEETSFAPRVRPEGPGGGRSDRG